MHGNEQVDKMKSCFHSIEFLLRNSQLSFSYDQKENSIQFFTYREDEHTHNVSPQKNEKFRLLALHSSKVHLEGLRKYS